MLLIPLLFLLAANGFAQMVPMGDYCLSSSSVQSCTMTYSAVAAPQIGPTTTVYQAIMTTYYNVVDCRYCTVTNVQANPPARGPFTTRVTSPVLVITAVGCMPETTAITRRDFRGYEEVETPVEPVEPQTSSSSPQPILPRFVQPASLKTPDRRRIWPRQSSGDPEFNISDLSDEAKELWTQCNTAIYALDLLNTPGVDTSALCRELRVDQGLHNSWFSAPGVDLEQCADIVCWTAVYGNDFNAPAAQVISDLIQAIWAIDHASSHHKPSNRTNTCRNINYAIQPYLGINASAVSSFVCKPTTTATTASVGTGLWSYSAPTGGAGPNTNSGSWGKTVGGDDSPGIEFPAPTPAGDGGPKYPPSPSKQPYYPVGSPTGDTVKRYRGY